MYCTGGGRWQEGKGKGVGRDVKWGGGDITSQANLLLDKLPVSIKKKKVSLRKAYFGIKGTFLTFVICLSNTSKQRCRNQNTCSMLSMVKRMFRLLCKKKQATH